ncbi:unnamed protein product [Umbelopsis ramanniana]
MAPLSKITNSVSIWLKFWVPIRGFSPAVGHDGPPILANQESYTKNDQPVLYSHPTMTNSVEVQCIYQHDIGLQKRASAAEPSLTPSAGNSIELLKKPIPPNYTSQLSPPSNTTIPDTFWTSNNNAMIAFFAVLGVFLVAIGLWVGYLVSKWYRRKHSPATSQDAEQALEETTQTNALNRSITQKANTSSIIINQEVVDSLCPSSRIDVDGTTLVNMYSLATTDEKAFIAAEGKSANPNPDIPSRPSEERFSHFAGNGSETTLEWRDTCAICLEDYLPQDYYRKLPCGHTFHTECVDTWFANTVKVEQIACPTCKADYSKQFEARQDVSTTQPPQQTDTDSILNYSIAASTIRFRRFKTWFRLVPPESEDDALRRQTRRQMRARRLMAYRMQQAELEADGGYHGAMYAQYPTFGKNPLYYWT